MKHFTTSALDGLCSEDQLDLLNSIDTLRSQGISHYISLPQIIVCGDQSSGKSSVLEAISGVAFPVKSNLCTRFPIELVLRKSPEVRVSVSIVPHRSRSESEQRSLESFREDVDSFEALPELIENVKAALGISTHGKAFSKDILRIEISGPDRPHLTIVDLPGLIHSETKQQSASDVDLVQDVVQAYMREPRSIILAVISAKNDIANQIVLKLARGADRSGRRTLGVITKPDTLIPGSPTESIFVSLAKNQEVGFRLGWHVLKNMDSEKGISTLANRDAEEEHFFSQGIWKDITPSILGIDRLRGRLSKVLLAQIATELPSLVDEIKVQIEACCGKLEKLGEPRATMHEQRLYLCHISQSFQSLAKAAVDGTYNEPFFEGIDRSVGYPKRMRAIAQNLNQDFADKISRYGHYRNISENEAYYQMNPHQINTTRGEFLNYIESLLKMSRGRELSGTFNSMVVKDLFFEQSAPWEKIARSHVNEVWTAAKEFLRLAIAHVADAATAKALFQTVFEPALEKLLNGLQSKTSELLIPHREGHPITYNHYFIETYQQIQNERRKEEYSTIIRQFFKAPDLHTLVNLGHRNDLHRLVESLVGRTERDMGRYASIEALDCMMAYYKVALKRFIDDMAIEAIEGKLISLLSNIFTPVAVFEMSDTVVTQIAGESEENKTERNQLNKQLDILTRGSATCKRFIGDDNFESKSGHQENFQSDAVTESKTQDPVDSPLEVDEAPIESSVECVSIPGGENAFDEIPAPEPVAELALEYPTPEVPVPPDVNSLPTSKKDKKKKKGVSRVEQVL
ncbi:interferon-induced GTP-binding protein Mx [Nannizzia gypsea CBS 118893]|uniref:Interferon-induced GTP-binding protein Mx n=1 Tax=Arthroderma gypseum (strain ATCC MYA-4604 / CBS 118893) TaxID=535722 RepID=E4UQV5_ARTGP|nr:interferon-induced GTP-binding protein Mx [Nannizzia gypsea CBS 118893]EFQ99281.1 interferon-induced GTP-binding protein Mx [Nannizzia gypsea CBS 118893]